MHPHGEPGRKRTPAPIWHRGARPLVHCGPMLRLTSLMVFSKEHLRPFYGTLSEILAGPVSSAAPRHEGQTLEKMDVLFILEKRAVQAGQGILTIAL